MNTPKHSKKDNRKLFRSINQRNIRKGVSIIELIVVVAVIGFLFTITAVSIKNFFLPSAKETSETIQSALKFAYNHSRLNHKTVIFLFDFDKNEFKVVRLEREDSGIQEKQVTKPVKLPFNNKIFAAYNLLGTEFREGILKIHFHPDGTSEDYTLLMGEEGNVKKSIQIFRYGGVIKILNGENIRIASKELTKVNYGVDERVEENLEDMYRY